MKTNRVSPVAAPLVVEGLSKRYGTIRAVDDLSFAVRAGAVTGFLGPKGAGRTRRRDRLFSDRLFTYARARGMAPTRRHEPSEVANKRPRVAPCELAEVRPRSLAL